ncbi:MAG: HIT family protein [Myxococcales bacterium]|nr:HIT family protein [Myxococcales bacterium]
MTSESCPFCAYAAGRFASELVVYEDAHVLVVPSLHQWAPNRGHCLVVSRAHVRDLYGLPPELAGPLLSAVADAARAAKAAFSADGITIRQNNEAAGGQDVFHIHFHVVPRFEGDRRSRGEFAVVDEPTRIAQALALRRAWPA